ncbi:MAG TPA: toxin-antitoxin system HicB family antitoxin [Mycobacteriales bacterium]|nr:toxin-antitoxin system HicB family antitoxin [Mycobacteriales bacterium]
MELSSLAELIGGDITALGRLGDETTADAAVRIVSALGGPINARLLEVLSQVAAEVDTQGQPAHVELRVVGSDARLVLISEAGGEEPAAAAPADGDTDARITLRLPAALKTAIEAAAAAEGVSVNSYIVRRLSTQPSQSTRPQQYGRRRMTGYGRS